jgi:molybdopterin synthase catalytic subunit
VSAGLDPDPVGGAIVRAEVTEAPIDVGAVLADVAHDAHGAAILFLGVVRDHNEGRPVEGIHYEAYRDMAEAELRRVARDCLMGDVAEHAPAAAADARETDQPEAAVAHALGARVSVVHRTGDLAVGDASLAVAVSTAHRADAYALSRAILEALKQRLPVWKKERYADGAAEWLDGRTPEPAA